MLRARAGMHTEDIGTNLFDGGAPFYGVYETSDNKFITLAPIEPHFYAQLLEALGLDPSTLPGQYDQQEWPQTRARIAAVVRTKSRDEWQALLEGTDVCFAPALSFAEAPLHHHNAQRNTYLPTPDGRADTFQVAPAPRLSRTPGEARASYAYEGSDTNAILTEFGFADQIEVLRSAGVVA